ncbi:MULTISPECIES: hypothetical protein [Bartonella]|uniref:hypothetical protein n=1 Tax=Bartonella TaxID=773 RepID=UPI0018DB801D|nr:MULTISPECIES: hypothetical protein [Bartonella]MBH9975064.1 hypothetical protein [Bartonella choladocola]MBI0014670.1 hypothetical protein [Bartonella sp. B10834G3]
MKAGLATSVAAHALILTWGLISLSSPADFNAEVTEALPVSLVPIAETTSIQKGELTASKENKAAPKPTTKPVEKPDAEHVGDGKVDNEAPLKPKEKDRDVDATPPPSGAPDADPNPVPPTKTPETKPDNTPKPEEKPKVEEQKPEESSKPDKAEPKPEESADATEPASEPKKDPFPNLPEKAPLPTAKPKPAEPKPAVKAKGESVDDILAMNEKALIDKTRTSGGGAARSQGPAGFGAKKNIGNGQDVGQTLVNAATSCITKNLKLAALGGGVAGENPVAEAKFNLSIEGKVVGEPIITGMSGNPNKVDLLINQTRAAIFACQPFEDLPRDQYDKWGQGFDLKIDPFNSF